MVRQFRRIPRIALPKMALLLIINILLLIANPTYAENSDPANPISKDNNLESKLQSPLENSQINSIKASAASSEGSSSDALNITPQSTGVFNPQGLNTSNTNIKNDPKQNTKDASNTDNTIQYSKDPSLDSKILSNNSDKSNENNPNTPNNTQYFTDPSLDHSLDNKNLNTTNLIYTSKNLNKENIPLTNQEQASIYYNQGLTALDNNQEIEATSAFKKALHQEPKYHKARIQLVQIYQKIGWHDENEKLLLEGLELAPQHSDFIKNLALLYQQTGRMRKSLSILLTMPENNIYQTDYLALLALAYLNTEHPDLAVNYYKKLLSINSNNSLWYLGLGIALEASGNYSNAIANLNKAKKIGRLNYETVDYINNRIAIMENYQS